VGERTLLSEEIRRLCQNKDNPLLSPLSENCLKAASYDIRVGATAIKSKPGGHEYVNFRLKESITIEPEQSCTFYSLEKLHIPANIQALLFNRYHWVTQRLNPSRTFIDQLWRRWDSGGFTFTPVSHLARGSQNERKMKGRLSK
jgi:deoxycytidine triphosphate deaminase